MDYYYISRKSPQGNEYLHITDGGKHVWKVTEFRATILPKDKADVKVKNLRTKGRKDCFYRPHFAYNVPNIFN